MSSRSQDRTKRGCAYFCRDYDQPKALQVLAKKLDKEYFFKSIGCVVSSSGVPVSIEMSYRGPESEEEARKKIQWRVEDTIDSNSRLQSALKDKVKIEIDFFYPEEKYASRPGNTYWVRYSCREPHCVTTVYDWSHQCIPCWFNVPPGGLNSNRRTKLRWNVCFTVWVEILT